MEGCFACDLAQGRRPLPGGLIHRQGGWLVEHCVGPLGVGTLIVKPERHVTAVGDLSDVEAAHLGPVLRKASQVAAELVDAEQVYNCLWSHADGVPVHIHYVIQPVTRAQMSEYASHGPELQVALFSSAPLPDAADIEAAARRARRLFGDG